MTISTNTASDDLLSNATSLGMLSNSQGSVRRTGNVAIGTTLTGLSANLDIEVLDQLGNLLFFSRNGGATSEIINTASLGIATYFIRIHPLGTAVSNYTLGLTVS